MSDILVKVIKGRSSYDINCNTSTTFAELRAKAEEQIGTVSGGIRLLHKGRTPRDNETLQDAKVVSGTKMMAMMTAKQRQEDVRVEKAEKDRQIEEARSKARSTKDKVTTEPVKKNVILGDEAVEGSEYVLLKKGREQFRVNITMNASVGELRSRVARMDGIDANQRDVKLLCKGKMLKDDNALLNECGLKTGGMVMVLFGMRHHDAKDAKHEIGVLEKETGELEALARKVIAKKRGRLLDEAGLAVEVANVASVIGRLKDNVNAVRGEEERKAAVKERLSQVETELEGLE